MIRLERVAGALPSGLTAMRGEARAEGHGMLDTLATEWESGASRFDREGEALLAAYTDGALAGIGGLTIDPYWPGALRMRRFYVRAPFRRLGIGNRIAAALLAQSGPDCRRITANAAPGSEAFWESLGFVAAQRERQTHLLLR